MFLYKYGSKTDSDNIELTGVLAGNPKIFGF